MTIGTNFFRYPARTVWFSGHQVNEHYRWLPFAATREDYRI